MCVNTLQFECTTFFIEHRRDGRNYSSQDTYQCFYNPDNEQFVSLRQVFFFMILMLISIDCRFDLASTKQYFLISFVIPASLWVVSCTCLVSSNKVKVFTSFVVFKMFLTILFQVLRISETTGQMRLSCRRRSVSPSEDTKVDVAESDSEDMADLQVKERVCKRRMAVVMMD